MILGVGVSVGVGDIEMLGVTVGVGVGVGVSDGIGISGNTLPAVPLKHILPTLVSVFSSSQNGPPAATMFPSPVNSTQYPNFSLTDIVEPLASTRVPSPMILGSFKLHSLLSN